MLSAGKSGVQKENWNRGKERMSRITKDELRDLIGEIVAAEIAPLKEAERKDIPHQPGNALTSEARLEKYLQDIVFRKALSEGTDSAGGYLVPTEHRAELIARLPAISELYPYVTKLSVQRDAGTVPRLLTDVSVTWDSSENSSATESEPTFEALSYTVHKVRAICTISQDLVEDSDPSISQVVTNLFVQAMAAERDRVIAIGNDDSQPYGIYYRIPDANKVDVSGSLTFDKLVELEHKLKKQYRMRARWIMGNTLHRIVMSLKDNNGQPLVKRDLSAGGPETLLGYPISQQDDLPDTWLGFGDLSRYYLFDRGLLSVQTDASGQAFEKDQVKVKIRERYDGDVALPEAFAAGLNITG